MKLLEFLRQQTGWSRRKIVNFHIKNPILVNSKAVPFSYQLEEGDQVLFAGKEYFFTSSQNYRYFLFHKPIGFVCSHRDKFNPTIFQILPSKFKNYFIAGRLDKNSRGLLILSSDGEFIHYLTHPKNQIEKEYLVKVSRKLSRKELERIRRGVKKYHVLKIEPLTQNFDYRIILTEGKKREIREIFRFFGINVLDLWRIRIDKYNLERLPEGKWKEVSIS